MTIEPFTSIAKAAGFKVLARSTDMFPAYQGGVVAAREGWAKANAATVKAFVGAYLQGLAWTLDPTNREAAGALLLAKMPDIRPGVVGAVLDSVLSPRSGLTPGGEVLPEGMQAVLALRSKYGRPQASLSDVGKYLDLSFAEDARRSL
jgi:ABC-type nitrate/sulfonate/bicarbonate transport system substrate-binding protein